jgi:hypothetical protein
MAIKKCITLDCGDIAREGPRCRPCKARFAAAEDKKKADEDIRQTSLPILEEVELADLTRHGIEHGVGMFRVKIDGQSWLLTSLGGLARE